jgi:lipoprotein signal peptidase
VNKELILKKVPQIKLLLMSCLLVFGSGLIIALDQMFKYKIRHSGGFYICNSGISFGLVFLPEIFWLISGVFLILTVFYFKFLIEKALFQPFYLPVYIFILGGALSNVIDRLVFGCVIDFFSIGLKFFPYFNMADFAIFLGSCCLVYLIMIKNRF